jgi:hypothetical protein
MMNGVEAISNNLENYDINLIPFGGSILSGLVGNLSPLLVHVIQ